MNYFNFHFFSKALKESPVLQLCQKNGQEPLAAQSLAGWGV